MDYAIYKQTTLDKATVIKRFTQRACRHRALNAARQNLDDMWRTILRKPNLYRNAVGGKDKISYDFPTSVNTSMHVSFYIAKLKLK